MSKQIFVIDGNDSATLEEFAADFTAKLKLEIDWQGNFDAFNDILYGSFGTPEGGFILIWKNSEISRRRLGYPATIDWLTKRIDHGRPYNVAMLAKKRELAEQEIGATLFDTLAEILMQPDHADIEVRFE